MPFLVNVDIVSHSRSDNLAIDLQQSAERNGEQIEAHAVKVEDDRQAQRLLFDWAAGHGARPSEAAVSRQQSASSKPSCRDVE